MCRLITGVVSKANYIVKGVEAGFFVETMMKEILAKVFVTVCSADCIRCVWTLVNAYLVRFPF